MNSASKIDSQLRLPLRYLYPATAEQNGADFLQLVWTRLGQKWFRPDFEPQPGGKYQFEDLPIDHWSGRLGARARFDQKHRKLTVRFFLPRAEEVRLELTGPGKDHPGWLLEISSPGLAEPRRPKLEFLHQLVADVRALLRRGPDLATWPARRLEPGTVNSWENPPPPRWQARPVETSPNANPWQNLLRASYGSRDRLRSLWNKLTHRTNSSGGYQWESLPLLVALEYLPEVPTPAGKQASQGWSFTRWNNRRQPLAVISFIFLPPPKEAVGFDAFLAPPGRGRLPKRQMEIPAEKQSAGWVPVRPVIFQFTPYHEFSGDGQITEGARPLFLGNRREVYPFQAGRAFRLRKGNLEIRHYLEPGEGAAPGFRGELYDAAHLPWELGGPGDHEPPGISGFLHKFFSDFCFRGIDGNWSRARMDLIANRIYRLRPREGFSWLLGEPEDKTGSHIFGRKGMDLFYLGRGHLQMAPAGLVTTPVGPPRPPC